MSEKTKLPSLSFSAAELRALFNTKPKVELISFAMMENHILILNYLWYIVLLELQELRPDEWNCIIYKRTLHDIFSSYWDFLLPNMNTPNRI